MESLWKKERPRCTPQMSLNALSIEESSPRTPPARSSTEIPLNAPPLMSSRRPPIHASIASWCTGMMFSSIQVSTLDSRFGSPPKARKTVNATTRRGTSDRSVVYVIADARRARFPDVIPLTTMIPTRSWRSANASIQGRPDSSCSQT